MTYIKPFKGLTYNKEKISDLSKVVCPPYDVISPDEQETYHNLHPNNFVHIILGKDKESDNKTENKYTRAKNIYDEWIHKGILVEDARPCIYYCKQEYTTRGQRYSRLGFISLMKLEDAKDSKVFPHENIHSRAKEDRLRLWSALKANLSPIFVCFSDKTKKVQKIFVQKISLTKPFIDVVDHDRVRHILWRLDDPALIEEIKTSLLDQHLFIADGHHRYEVALEYRRQRLSQLSKTTGQEPFNYVMTYFTNMDSSDLTIFPMHRIIKKFTASIDFLEESFRIDRVKTKEDLLIILAKAGQNEHAFGLYTKEGIKLLRLKNRLMVDEIVKEGSKEFRQLDATILKYFILDRLNIQSDDIMYTKDLQEATGLVDESRADASFIMNPVKIQQLKAIALNGERMPPKTTYFYPKVLSGLTVYRMDS